MTVGTSHSPNEPLLANQLEMKNVNTSTSRKSSLSPPNVVPSVCLHPAKVVDNCSHTAQDLEDDLKLKGEPISESGINVFGVSIRLGIQILLSLFFFFVEFFTGMISGSIALIADSYHMLADVMALIVAFICLQMAYRKSKSNSYGWVRAEALGGFLNGLFLLTVCLNIVMEASARIYNPSPIGQPLHVLAVGFIGLLINLVGLVLLHGHGHGHSHGGGSHGHSHGGSPGHGHSHGNGGHSSKGHGHSHDKPAKSTVKMSECAESLLDHEEKEPKEVEHSGRLSRANTNFSSMERRFTGPGVPYATHMASELLDEELSTVSSEMGGEEKGRQKKKQQKNVNIRGVYLHLMSDALGSIIVIFAAGIVYLFPQWSWSAYFDPVLSLCLATMMSFSAYGLTKDSIDILLMKPPHGLENNDILKDMNKIAGVVSVSDLDVWSLTGSRHIATARVAFCHPAIFKDAVFKIRKYFHDLGIHSITIEPTFETSCMEVMKVTVEQCEKEHKVSTSCTQKDETELKTPVSDSKRDIRAHTPSSGAESSEYSHTSQASTIPSDPQ